MSVELTPSKRPNETEANGRGKLQKSGNYSSQNLSGNGTVLRVLCPSSKIGSVIGKGGSIISQIRQESGAKVRVEEPVPGCDERVIVIVGPDKDSPDKDNGRGVEPQQRSEKEENDENGESEPGKNDVDVNGSNEDKKEDSGAAAEVERGGEGKETALAAMQKALLLVLERMIEGDLEKDGGGGGGDEESDKESSFVVRLLVFSSQIGCLLGKAGSVIKQMALDSGAQIRILPRDKLFPPASPSDELVQVIFGTTFPSFICINTPADSAVTYSYATVISLCVVVSFMYTVVPAIERQAFFFYSEP